MTRLGKLGGRGRLSEHLAIVWASRGYRPEVRRKRFLVAFALAMEFFLKEVDAIQTHLI